jgi:hypothetical protein
METSHEAKSNSRHPISASFTNRMGRQYFVHQGLTKTGKPKYFASLNPDGALMRLPKGYVFGESINGVVTIQRQRQLTLPLEDIASAERHLQTIRHLQDYRAAPKNKSIIIYEPVGMDAVKALTSANTPSMLDSLKAMLGPSFESALANTAKELGILVEEYKRIDAAASAERNRKTREHMIKNMQYSAVMRFTAHPLAGTYQAERRCYRGNEEWIVIDSGSLEKLLKKYTRHIGKESFFDLI